ncbi:MAG: hypothetical protein ACRDQ5_11500 [Sciscionella sp.]
MTETTWLRNHAALGHRRLAVIDLPGGAQPMAVTAPTGETVGRVYSGETYNYRELRDELRGRDHRFETDSDTEVVLRGYLEWGEALADRLNGMYAFAIWSGMREVGPGTVVTVDRNGVHEHVYWKVTTQRHTDGRDASIAHVPPRWTSTATRRTATLPRSPRSTGWTPRASRSGVCARSAICTSVVERVKSPYPSTQGPKYVRAIAGQARGVVRPASSEVNAMEGAGINLR